jgi:hypothetical protein
MDRKRFGNLPQWAYPVQNGNMLAGAARQASSPIDVMGMLSTLPEGVNGTMQSVDPSLRDRIGWGAGNLFGSLGADKHLQRYAANKIGGAIDLVPGIGDAVGVDDAYQDYKSGNLGMAAAGAGFAAFGLIPGAGDAVAAAGKKGIRAFHGSPHSFDKFDLSKIGTGEGAQAYGHGLYFAESENVAKSYRDALSGAQPFDLKAISPEAYKLMDFDITSFAGDATPDIIAQEAANFVTSGGRRPRWMQDETYDAMRAANLPKADPGSMYEVNINADPEDFLDWDMPLAGQSPNIRDSVRKLAPSAPGMASGQSLLDAISPHNATPYTSAADRARAASTEKLREAGIPGIKYLDAGSRASGDGSRNYVVFDDKLIDIVKKYGIAAALSAGLISQQMAEQMQAQGIGEL